jgi:small subunit ribosomal protein S19
MARSQKKLPYVDPRLMEKIKKVIIKSKAAAAAKGTSLSFSIPPIKTYARNCTIVDAMLGLEFLVHNGRKFISVKIHENLLGHKLGEFSPTRTFNGHPLLKKQKEENKKGGK